MEGGTFPFSCLSQVYCPQKSCFHDYTCVNHRFAFSKNGQPTIVPVPNPDVAIGRADRMSPTDIRRVNILYNCSVQVCIVSLKLHNVTYFKQALLQT